MTSILSIDRIQNSEHIKGFLLFHLLEYLIFFAIIFWCWNKEEWKKHHAFFIIALICLLLIPLKESRMWNDWTMRTSIPALYIMWVFLLQKMFSLPRRSIKYTVIGFLIIIGSVTTFKEYERSVDWLEANRRDLYPVQSMTVEFYDLRYKIQYFSPGDGKFHQNFSSHRD